MFDFLERLAGASTLALLATLGYHHSLGFLGRLRDEDRVDVGQNASGGDGHTAEELVKLLVITDSQLDVTRHNASLLIIPRGVAG